MGANIRRYTIDGDGYGSAQFDGFGLGRACPNNVGVSLFIEGDGYGDGWEWGNGAGDGAQPRELGTRGANTSW
jgi:hypothetical protein